MRAALLADIHGNLLALEAVLRDIEARGGVDTYWVLGNLAAIGYDPGGVLKTLAALPEAIFIRGNADRYVTSSDFPTPADMQANPYLKELIKEVAASFGWTKGYITAMGWLDWLRDLPIDYRLTLPDGTRVLLVHAAPGNDDGTGLPNSLTDNEFRTAVAGCDADLVLVGHFHFPMDRTLDGIRAINPGCVSNPFAPDLRAAYAILTADENGYQVDFHRADYDRQAVIELTQRVCHPDADYIIRFLKGEKQADWMKRWDGVSYTVTNTE